MQSFILYFLVLTFIFLCLPPMLIFKIVCQKRLDFLFEAVTHCGANHCSHFYYTQNTITQLTQMNNKHISAYNEKFKFMPLIVVTPYYQTEATSVLITLLQTLNCKRPYSWYWWFSFNKIRYFQLVYI